MMSCSLFINTNLRTTPGKKVLWLFYYSSTLVFLEEIGTVKLWVSIQCIFPIQNLSITVVTEVILKYMEVILKYLAKLYSKW